MPDPFSRNTFGPDDTLPTDFCLYCADVRAAVMALLPALDPAEEPACDDVFYVGAVKFNVAPIGSAPGAWRVKADGAYLGDFRTARAIAEAVDTYLHHGKV